MGRHMCEEASFSDVRKACQLAAFGGVLELYGMKIPLVSGKRDENFAHVTAYDDGLTHEQNVIAWLDYWEARNRNCSIFGSTSSYPLINVSLQTNKADLGIDNEFFHVDSSARILLKSGSTLSAPFCNIVNDLFTNVDLVPQRTKLAVAQEYLRNVVTAVIRITRKEELAYYARSMIFILMKDDEPHVNIVDGSFDLFKLSELLVNGFLGGPVANDMLECFSTRVKEEQARQSKLLDDVVFGHGQRAGKSLLGHQLQIIERLRRGNNKKLHKTTTIVIQGLGKHGQRR